jgi:hypothetical protein
MYLVANIQSLASVRVITNAITFLSRKSLNLSGEEHRQRRRSAVSLRKVTCNDRHETRRLSSTPEKEIITQNGNLLCVIT